MVFGFHELQACLAEWPSSISVLSHPADPLIGRIGQILEKSIKGRTLDKKDLQPLIRQLLMRETVVRGQSVDLKVPATDGWPTSDEWASHAIDAMIVDTGAFYLISAKPWNPEWLETSDDDDVFKDIYSDKVVREDGRCPADPFIEAATGFKEYSCPGQREAIRATFLMPHGETLIVHLPTGSGKSLVGHAPALVHRQEGNLTLFVVPTVALAIDQAKQIEPFLYRNAGNKKQWPLVWYGGMDDAERSEIRRRLQDGTQRILFTSPEALTTTLLSAIYDVVNNGMLRYLVIDEAHLISQWGDEFRPAFQMLAGLRNGLLRQVVQRPFRTLLLSATFTPETVDSLTNLFGPPEKVQLISAIHLRPEPQYWWYRAQNTEEKKELILEALRHAPRPFILYVTTRKQAYLWYRCLENAGYVRIRLFHGDTPDSERGEIIDQWRADLIDGVVATSAFGVGIDKQDIRTIIHATIPETLDRFYQEVGRGGRDGLPSISLLLYENSDWSIVNNMASPKLISTEIGFDRWEALYHSRIKNQDGDGFNVNLEALRPRLLENNDENERWNMRTLLLMARAGVLRIEFDFNAKIDDTKDESTIHHKWVRIRLISEDHLTEHVWNGMVADSRNRTLETGERNIEMIYEMLDCRREVSDILAGLYKNACNKWRVDVARTCGGCPLDRKNMQHRKTYHIPIANPIYRTFFLSTDIWVKTFPYLDPRHVSVFYDPILQKDMAIKFLSWLVKYCDLKEVCFPGDSWVAKTEEVRDLYKIAPDRIVLNRGGDEANYDPYTPLHRVTVINQGFGIKELSEIFITDRPLHIVLFPLQTLDPRNPRRHLVDVVENSSRLEQLYSAIQS